MPEISPTEVLATGDPGDETINRYSYQWAYTGIVACGLFDDSTGIIDVFCEHYEDILVRYRDDTFHAIQVKTRQLGLELWRANDVQMCSSLVRFVKLEFTFPGKIRRYSIITNHQFFEARKTKDNLPYLLTLASLEVDVSSAKRNRQLAPMLNNLAKESGHDVSIVLATLKKVNCDHRPPKMDGIQKELCDCLRQSHSRCSDLPYGELFRLAKEITAEISRAGGRQHAQSVPLFLNLAIDSAEAQVRVVIEGKRLTRNRFERIIEEVVAASALLSTADPNAQPHPLPSGNSRLRQKLDAGGLSAMTADAALDCYAAAFKQQREWAAKYGEEKALKRYQHMATLIRSEAAASYEAQQTPSGTFGRKMLEDLRQRISARRRQADAAFFDATDEHMLGYAYMLTDECKIWWSHPFQIQQTMKTEGPADGID